MATNEMPAVVAEQEPAVYPVFQCELMKALVDTLHKQNTILANLTEVTRDLRDELALARAERKAARP